MHYQQSALGYTAAGVACVLRPIFTATLTLQMSEKGRGEGGYGLMWTKADEAGGRFLSFMDDPIDP